MSSADASSAPGSSGAAPAPAWPDIDLRHLAVLRAIERDGSLAAAGRSLNIATPTVVHHLDALERAVGTRLVERSPRGTRLTDIGRVLAGHAEAILERVRSARAEVRSLARAGVATLRVGTFSSAGALLLPEAIGRVRRATGVRVELRESETAELLAAVADGSLHAALVYTESDEPLGLPEGWVATEVLDDPYLIALPEGHPALGAGGTVRLADLRDDAWILSRAEAPGAAGLADRALLAAAADLGFVPQPVLRTDDFHVAGGFVAAGLGVTLLPRLAAAPRPGIVLCTPVDAEMSRRILVVHPQPAPRAVALLVRSLTEAGAGDAVGA